MRGKVIEARRMESAPKRPMWRMDDQGLACPPRERLPTRSLRANVQTNQPSIVHTINHLSLLDAQEIPHEQPRIVVATGVGHRPVVARLLRPSGGHRLVQAGHQRLQPAAEIVKDGDDAVVRLELPGVDVEKDVTVEVERGRLVIHGEHRDEHAEDKDGRTLREIRYGSFRRSFRLPEHVTGEAVTASYETGVLTVRVAGAYEDRAGNQARRIEITK